MYRFSITATRDMNIDDMRIALINYILSRQSNNLFMVYINDSDEDSNIASKDQETLDIIKRFAIEQDKLLYQSDNLGRQQQFALSLVSQKKAFVCICDDKCINKCSQKQANISTQIKEQNLAYTIRINKAENDIKYIDKIQGNISVQADEIDSFIILNNDGSPTYDFASSCNDMITNISIIVQKTMHPINIARQIHIRNSFGYAKEIEYANLPSISKDKTITIKQLLEDGFLLDSIINYLLLASNKTPVEIFTLPNAIEWFDIKDISDIDSTFDIKKLREINQRHLTQMQDIPLSKIFGFADADIGKLIKLYLKDLSTINELDDIIKSIFKPKNCIEEWKTKMQDISNIILKAPMFKTFSDLKKHLMNASKLTEQELDMPLQLLLTGSKKSPNLDDIYPLIKSYITEIARCK